MSVPEVTTRNTTTVPPTEAPLTQEEKARFISEAMATFALTQEQAEAMLEKLEPGQVRTYLDLASGKSNITREQAKEMWGLSDDEVQAMFGDKEEIGIFDNPFGDLFLRFLMLSYSLGLDIKKLMSQVSGLRFEQAIEAAQKRKDGAILEFACAMASAAIFVAFAGGSFYKINSMKNEKANPHDPTWQWLSPMTANLLVSPINSGGQFGKALEEFKASVLDGNNQLLDNVFQQLMNAWQGHKDAQDTYRSGL
ncbi:hypothetical protein [Limnobacter sp.]|uniref:hypothetical protein n=1 Tax=Limnobacter sp. TaxID=2003368 RepID=UPI002FE36496